MILPRHYIVIICMAIMSVAVGCSNTQGYDSSNYEEGQFRNQTDAPAKGPLSYLWMRLNTTSEPWPEHEALKQNIVVPEETFSQLRIHFINHSSFLIQIDGQNILTDPIWSDRASPFSWVGPKRVIKPGLTLDQLPRIDVILVSHDHYDHLDIPTINAIAKRDDPKILSGLGVGKHLSGLRFVELDWGQKSEIENITYTFEPAQHSSGRGLTDQNSTLWGAFVIEGITHTIYFGGDTGFGPHFENTAQMFPEINVAILPIGAYEPRDFMKFNHMNPQDAVKALEILGAESGIGMHWGTFKLTNEGRLRPLQYFQRNAISSFFVAQNGDCFQIDQRLKRCGE